MEHLVFAAHLDNEPQIDNRYLMADILDRTKVMRNEQIGDSEILLEFT